MDYNIIDEILDLKNLKEYTKKQLKDIEDGVEFANDEQEKMFIRVLDKICDLEKKIDDFVEKGLYMAYGQRIPPVGNII